LNEQDNNNIKIGESKKKEREVVSDMLTISVSVASTKKSFSKR